MLHGDDHVPQRHQPGARVRVLLRGQLAGVKVELREAQHIRSPVHLPHVTVDGVDILVIGQQHVHLAGYCHTLRRQSGADDLADKGAAAGAVCAGHVGGDGNIMTLRHGRFPPFPPFLAVS